MTYAKSLNRERKRRSKNVHPPRGYEEGDFSEEEFYKSRVRYHRSAALDRRIRAANTRNLELIVETESDCL